MSPRHHAHNRAVHVDPIEDGTNYWKITCSSNPCSEPASARHHGRQRPAPRRRNKAESSKGRVCRKRQRVGCGMPGGDCCERKQMQLGDDVSEECDVGSRFPRQCRAWLIAKAWPINRDRGEGRREPLLKGAHLVPC